MILSEEIKCQIRSEFEQFKAQMYAGKSKEQRKALGQFFTPAEISIQMIEAFDAENLADKVIFDPTCGSGNLLAACMIAGADPAKLFGNELDLKMVTVCRIRLRKLAESLGKPKTFKHWQVHQGDALQSECLTNFSPNYRFKL